LNATAYQPEIEEGEIASDESATDASEPVTDAPTDAGPGEAPAPVAPPGVAPAAPVPPPAGPAPQSRARRMRGPRSMPLTPSLLSFDFGVRGVSLRPGIPSVDVRPIYTATEVAQFGVAPGTQVLIPAVGGRF
jgi:hypothetical protein